MYVCVSVCVCAHVCVRMCLCLCLCLRLRLRLRLCVRACVCVCNPVQKPSSTKKKREKRYVAEKRQGSPHFADKSLLIYGVPTTRRLLKITGLFCRIQSLL